PRLSHRRQQCGEPESVFTQVTAPALCCSASSTRTLRWSQRSCCSSRHSCSLSAWPILPWSLSCAGFTGFASRSGVWHWQRPSTPALSLRTGPNQTMAANPELCCNSLDNAQLHSQSAGWLSLSSLGDQWRCVNELGSGWSDQSDCRSSVGRRHADLPCSSAPTEHICAEIIHVPGHQHLDGFHDGGLGYPLRSRAVAHKSPCRARRTFS